MIDYLGNIGGALKRGDPAELRRLYEGLRLEIIYHSDQKLLKQSSGWVGIVNVSKGGLKHRFLGYSRFSRRFP
jgi:hypothetical protein